MKHFPLIFVAVITLMIASCRTQREYVPYFHYDTLLVATQTYDSIYLHDSIYIHERQDTVIVERWHTQYRDRIRHDTTYISKVDTITIPQEVIKTVNQPTILQKVLEAIGAIAVLLFIASLISSFRK